MLNSYGTHPQTLASLYRRAVKSNSNSIDCERQYSSEFLKLHRGYRGPMFTKRSLQIARFLYSFPLDPKCL